MDYVYVDGFSISDKPLLSSTVNIGEWSELLTFRKIMFLALFALLIYAVITKRSYESIAIAVVMAVMAWRGDKS